MNPTILGVIGPGFLNQVPTLNHGSVACQEWFRSALPVRVSANRSKETWV